MVKIKKIIGPTPSGAAVLLGNDTKTFVVFVGPYEAAALLREMNHEVPARPLTHELIQNVFLGFNLEIKHVIISAILENTFCATLVLQQRIEEGKEGWAAKRNEVRIDARPSDCFVLALKNDKDVFVTRDVFSQVQDVSKMTEEVEGSLAQNSIGTTPIGPPMELGEEPTALDFDIPGVGDPQEPDSDPSFLDDVNSLGELPDEEAEEEEDDDDGDERD